MCDISAMQNIEMLFNPPTSRMTLLGTFATTPQSLLHHSCHACGHLFSTELCLAREPRIDPWPQGVLMHEHHPTHATTTRCVPLCVQQVRSVRTDGQSVVPLPRGDRCRCSSRRVGEQVCRHGSQQRVCGARHSRPARRGPRALQESSDDSAEFLVSGHVTCRHLR
jgi:hypothetical protein